MTSKKYPKELLELAIEKSDSIREMMITLNVKPTGGNYNYISRLVKIYELDTSHFTYRKNASDKSKSQRKTANEILILETNPLASRVQASKLTRALIEIGIPYECDNCGLYEWLGERITLDVDHIDGNYLDNRKENLRFLCPNCHRQTPTFSRSKKSLTPESKQNKICECGRTKQARSKTCAVCYAEKGGSRNFGKIARDKSRRKDNECLDCGVKIYPGSMRCEKHYHISRKGKLLEPSKNKIQWPDDASLIERLKESNYLTLSKELGVSDNAIRKRLRVRGYDTKTLKKI